MKLNINWKALGLQLLKAIWPVLAGALTGATVVTATGCTSMATQPRGQTTEIIHGHTAAGTDHRDHPG